MRVQGGQKRRHRKGVAQVKDLVPDSQQVVVAEEDAVNEAEENEERWTILEATDHNNN